MDALLTRFITCFNFCLFFLQIYLSQYGYLSPKVRNPSSGGNLLSQESWETSIREFQAFAGLNVTGRFLNFLCFKLLEFFVNRRAR